MLNTIWPYKIQTFRVQTYDESNIKWNLTFTPTHLLMYNVARHGTQPTYFDFTPFKNTVRASLKTLFIPFT